MNPKIIKALERYAPQLRLTDFNFIRDCEDPEEAIQEACDEGLQRVAQVINDEAWQEYSQTMQPVEAAYSAAIAQAWEDLEAERYSIGLRLATYELTTVQADALDQEAYNKQRQVSKAAKAEYSPKLKAAQETLLHKLLNSLDYE